MSFAIVYFALTATVLAIATSMAEPGMLTFGKTLKLVLFWPLQVVVALAIIQRYGPHRATDHRNIAEYYDETFGTGALRSIVDLVL